MRHPTVLVFVEFPDPTGLSMGFRDSLRYPDAEVVGVRTVGEDEAPAAIREEHAAAYAQQLDTMAEALEAEGVRAETDLVFAADRVTARERIADRDDVDAILLPGEANTIGRVLVGVKDRRSIDRLTTVLGVVDPDDIIELTLLHVLDPETDERATGETLLQTATDAFAAAGVSEATIDRQLVESADPDFQVSQAARDHDLAVVGRTDRDIEDRILGPVSDHIASQAGVPVLVVTGSTEE